MIHWICTLHLAHLKANFSSKITFTYISEIVLLIFTHMVFFFHLVILEKLLCSTPSCRQSRREIDASSGASNTRSTNFMKYFSLLIFRNISVIYIYFNIFTAIIKTNSDFSLEILSFNEIVRVSSIVDSAPLGGNMDHKISHWEYL